jgi:hypothetical protein
MEYLQQLNSHTLYMTMIKISPNTSNSNGFSLNDGIIMFKPETKKAKN